MSVIYENELEAIHQTFHRLETRWHESLDPDGPWHTYDPLPIAIFLDGIRVAIENTRGRCFLDVGCGIGTKLAFMSCLGYEVSGIEKVKSYVESARELVPEATIVESDILKIESFDSDIVYLYGPSKDPKIEAEIEQHIADNMVSGSVMFRAKTIVDYLPNGIRQVGTDVGVKI